MVHIMNITAIFDLFIKRCREKYLIGNPQVYTEDLLPVGDQYCINPYLKTEDDVKVKFGGFLEQEFLNQDLPLVVHSELRLYKKFPHHRADLSVHTVSENNLWLHHETILTSLQAVIEIKYENFKHPDYSLKKGHMEADMKQLASLGPGLEKYLLILDEANRMDAKSVREIQNLSKKYHIVLLSNNKMFLT